MAELGVYYAIRHKATGQFMPQLRGRGYTFWNPASTSPTNNLGHNKNLGTPRLLPSRRKAVGCINQWNCNPNASMRGSSGMFGEDIDIAVTPDGRKKEDLEIVEVLVTPFTEIIQKLTTGGA